MFVDEVEENHTFVVHKIFMIPSCTSSMRSMEGLDDYSLSVITKESNPCVQNAQIPSFILHRATSEKRS